MANMEPSAVCDNPQLLLPSIQLSGKHHFLGYLFPTSINPVTVNDEKETRYQLSLAYLAQYSVKS